MLHSVQFPLFIFMIDSVMAYYRSNIKQTSGLPISLQTKSCNALIVLQIYSTGCVPN